ncbi:MAG: type II secretion system GspH family protein [Candidatus Sumerlaeaceae bacterium]|nr:type II secretion system GspH family protein [Candidatus Sumerlaeaceae bacterium]
MNSQSNLRPLASPPLNAIIFRNQNSKAFTLIELLVVVGILAVLALIAIPNLHFASTRAKIARIKADQRTLATALESYATDHTAYPLCNPFGVAGSRPSAPGDPAVLERLSTPVAYISNAFVPAPFSPTNYSAGYILGVGPIETNIGVWPPIDQAGPEAALYKCYQYTATHQSDTTLTGDDRATVNMIGQGVKADAFILQAAGPTLGHINMGGVVANSDAEYSSALLYDPTNGTVSFGAIFRVGGQTVPDNNFYTVTAGK